MKLKYEAPELNIIIFSSSDIMSVSGNNGGTGGWDGEGDPIEMPSVGI